MVAGEAVGRDGLKHGPGAGLASGYDMAGYNMASYNMAGYVMAGYVMDFMLV